MPHEQRRSHKTRDRIPALGPEREVQSILRVLPGEFRVTGRADSHLLTVLGSCVTACVRHRETQLGGINHFMLPHSRDGNWNGQLASPRYGNFAMDLLIRKVLRDGDSERDLEIKIFGGADNSQSRVGRSNVEFVLDYLATRRLSPQVVDVGGSVARKIIYTPSTGRVLRRLVGTEAELVEEDAVLSAEPGGLRKKRTGT